jgi:hypothetical protein
MAVSMVWLAGHDRDLNAEARSFLVFSCYTSTHFHTLIRPCPLSHTPAVHHFNSLDALMLLFGGRVSQEARRSCSFAASYLWDPGVVDRLLLLSSRFSNFAPRCCDSRSPWRRYSTPTACVITSLKWKGRVYKGSGLLCCWTFF